MKPISIVSLLALSMIVSFECAAQSLTTKVVRLEIDQKEVKKNYKVFLYSRGREFEAKRTRDGFIVPDELKSEEYLCTSIIIGKYRLDFSNIPISKFHESWRIGIDRKPFSKEYITSDEAKKTKLVYYVQFSMGEVVVKVGLPES